MSEQVGESRFGEGVKNEATGSRFHVKPANVKLETVPLGTVRLSFFSVKIRHGSKLVSYFSRDTV